MYHLIAWGNVPWGAHWLIAMKSPEPWCDDPGVAYTNTNWIAIFTTIVFLFIGQGVMRITYTQG